jgi:hypothetical protein
MSAIIYDFDKYRQARLVADFHCVDEIEVELDQLKLDFLSASDGFKNFVESEIKIYELALKMKG